MCPLHCLNCKVSSASKLQNQPRASTFVPINQISTLERTLKRFGNVCLMIFTTSPFSLNPVNCHLLDFSFNVSAVHVEQNHSI